MSSFFVILAMLVLSVGLRFVIVTDSVLRAAVESASWAKGRGAGMETGAVGVGRTGSVAPGRRGTILAGCCWVGTPGVPDPLSMSRQGVE